jgi:hypothetical protein
MVPIEKRYATRTSSGKVSRAYAQNLAVCIAGDQGVVRRLAGYHEPQEGGTVMRSLCRFLDAIRARRASSPDFFTCLGSFGDDFFSEV